MKTYRRHDCDRRHRTYRTLAECMFRRAWWVTGEGPYASVCWCGRPTVMLFATLQEAERALREVARTGCGSRCYERHELIYIIKDQELAA